MVEGEEEPFLSNEILIASLRVNSYGRISFLSLSEGSGFCGIVGALS
jgi:hypothetical protein